MNKTEIIVCGFGGQGIIFAGELIGRAALEAGLESVQTAVYGAEARGSACHAGVVISSEPIAYPKVRHPDILIAMSQDAYDKFAPTVPAGGRIFFECTLLNATRISGIEQLGFPAAEAAERIGRRAVANVVMASLTMASMNIVDKQYLKRAIVNQSPQAFQEINLRALEAGWWMVQEAGEI